MNDDAVAQLRRAISTPVNTMTVVTVSSSKQAGDILRTVAEGLHNRPWIELPMPCTEGAVGTLLKTARQLTATWPPEEGVLFLSDATPPNRPPASGVEFWRAMNLQRENWAGLNCHLVFLLTLQNYEQLLIAADHLASWIPIKLDARRLTDEMSAREMFSDGFIQPSKQNREEARQRFEELERGLAATLAEGAQDAPTLLLRRYYLPMMEAALNANLLEQADTLGKSINPDDVPDPDKPRWWRAVCDTLLRGYRLEDARREAERYLSWAECGKHAREAAEAHGKLAEVLYNLGDLSGARAHCERALKIDETAYGPEHPKVATQVNNLGLVLRDLGDLSGARAHLERALKMVEDAYGPEHPKVATQVNNLGLVLRDLGDLSGARAHLERALKMVEDAYGPEHPEVARGVNNLGGVLYDLGDLAGAQAHWERALKIDETAYGPEHPEVARDVSNLGLLMKALGDLAGARAYCERALKMVETAYGPDHPNVSRDVNNLGSVLHDLGDLAGARIHYERALKIDEAAYGPDHPNVARDVNNLGLVLRDLGDLAGARAHYERALAIRRLVLGDDHPDTKRVERNLAALEE